MINSSINNVSTLVSTQETAIFIALVGSPVMLIANAMHTTLSCCAKQWPMLHLPSAPRTSAKVESRLALGLDIDLAPHVRDVIHKQKPQHADGLRARPLQCLQLAHKARRFLPQQILRLSGGW